MKKKILLALILITISIVALGTISVSAEIIASGSGPNFAYTLDNEGLLTITGIEIPLWIPESQNIKKVIIQEGVTSIDTTFANCKNIESVELPNSLTSIGDCAFLGCDKLTKITMGKNVQSIGYAAFYECKNLEFIEIPSSVKHIGNSAFQSCESLKKVTIPDGIEKLELQTFYNCHALTEIIIPDSITHIDDCTFMNCSSLSKIYLGKNLTYVGSNAFFNCSKLEEVYIDSLNAWMRIKFNSPYSTPMCYAKNIYINDNIITDVQIPDGIFNIYDYAFYNWKTIEAVIIGKDVEIIGDSVFSFCESLNNIEVAENNIRYFVVDGVLFDKNKSTLIKLPQKDTRINYTIPNITNIAAGAFHGCTNVQHILIPESVKKIGEFAFDGCDNLIYNHTDGIDYLGNTQNPYYVAVKGNEFIVNVELQPSTHIICDRAFLNCQKLISIKMPSNITEISAATFSGCISLSEITIPDKVTNIGQAAFAACSSLKEISIPYSVQTINDTAFAECTALENVYIDEGLTTIKEYAFINCSSLKNLILPNTLISIGSNACYGCTELKEITIPKTLKNIGIAAFAICTNLTTVNYTGTEDELEALKSNSGDYNDSLFNATINYIAQPPIAPHTKTYISNKGQVFIINIKPTNIDNGKTIILALYNDNRMVYVNPYVYAGESTIPFSTTENFDKVKVFVWENLDTCVPLCEAEEVPLN